MAISFAGPFFLSFDKKVAFYKNWPALFKAIAIVAPLFLIWDIIFTKLGFWGFNPDYTSGVYLFGLPLGEYLFFIVIPYCCVFVYEVLNRYIHKDLFASVQGTISNFLMGFGMSLAVVFYDRWYTFLTFLFLTALVYWLSRVRQVAWLGRFYLAYLVIAIPFFVINGILTGMGIGKEVVWYNDLENTGKRILTIPMEDFFYGFLLILIIVTLFEYFRNRKITSS